MWFKVFFFLLDLTDYSLILIKPFFIYPIHMLDEGFENVFQNKCHTNSIELINLKADGRTNFQVTVFFFFFFLVTSLYIL